MMKAQRMNDGLRHAASHRSRDVSKCYRHHAIAVRSCMRDRPCVRCRTQAFTLRRKEMSVRGFVFGHCTVRTRPRQLIVGGHERWLAPRAFDLLILPVRIAAAWPCALGLAAALCTALAACDVSHPAAHAEAAAPAAAAPTALVVHAESYHVGELVAALGAIQSRRPVIVDSSGMAGGRAAVRRVQQLLLEGRAIDADAVEIWPSAAGGIELRALAAGASRGGRAHCPQSADREPPNKP